MPAMIISSMGGIYDPPFKDLQKLLRRSDKEMWTVGRTTSETVIVGRIDLWRLNAREIDPRI
jgi:hypothetical protein